MGTASVAVFPCVMQVRVRSGVFGGQVCSWLIRHSYEPRADLTPNSNRTTPPFPVIVRARMCKAANDAVRYGHHILLTGRPGRHASRREAIRGAVLRTGPGAAASRGPIHEGAPPVPSEPGGRQWPPGHPPVARFLRADES